MSTGKRQQFAIVDTPLENKPTRIEVTVEDDYGTVNEVLVEFSPRIPAPLRQRLARMVANGLLAEQPTLLTEEQLKRICHPA